MAAGVDGMALCVACGRLMRHGFQGSMAVRQSLQAWMLNGWTALSILLRGWMAGHCMRVAGVLSPSRLQGDASVATSLTRRAFISCRRAWQVIVYHIQGACSSPPKLEGTASVTAWVEGSALVAATPHGSASIDAGLEGGPCGAG